MGLPRFPKKDPKKDHSYHQTKRKHGKFFKCQNQIPERWFQMFQMFHLDHLWCANCNYMKSIQTLHKKWSKSLKTTIDLLLVWCPQSVLWLYSCFMDPYYHIGEICPDWGKLVYLPMKNSKKNIPVHMGLVTVDGRNPKANHLGCI